jgi:Protein of unknown function (DUF1348)
MNAKNPTFWISACVVALLAEPGVPQAQTLADADVVTAISNLENDAVKADLAGVGWFRAYGNEQWEFDTDGLMRRREGSVNDVPIRGSDRNFHWLAGPRPADHGGLTELGL